MSAHQCDAVVVCCIDFRFQSRVRDFLAQLLPARKYDYIGLAGSTLNMDLALSQVDVSVRLHACSQAVIIHHQDCGAYGPADSKSRHQADMRQFRDKLGIRYPWLRVSLYWVDLLGKFHSAD